MSTIRNQVQLIGNAGMNPEVTVLESGQKVARLTLATHEIFRDSSGNRVSETMWHTIIAKGKKAEIMEKYIRKGNELAVHGKLVHRTFNDKEGNKRNITEVHVDEVIIFGSR